MTDIEKSLEYTQKLFIFFQTTKQQIRNFEPWKY